MCEEKKTAILSDGGLQRFLNEFETFLIPVSEGLLSYDDFFSFRSFTTVNFQQIDTGNYR